MQRRALLITAATLAATRPGVALAQALRRTPGQILGPYYPVAKPDDVDADLTHVGAGTRRAAGEVIEISGRVFSEAGRPVPYAAIEIWQADARGHYHHPSDRSAGAADPDFQGYAAFTCDADGHYRFVSIRPGSYPDDGNGGVRAPHIHFQVTGRVNRLVTQMYFAGEPLNDTDRVLAFANAGRERLMLKAAPSGSAGGIQAGVWDIVLRDG